MKRYIVNVIACYLCIFPLSLCADLINENLLVSVPENFKVDFEKKEKNMTMMEMVLLDQSVQNWTQMVTVQVFFNLAISLEDFQKRLNKLWTASCSESESIPIGEGTENGYSFMIWLQACPLNKTTNKPELTWFKTIRGNDSLYVVQKAFKYSPKDEEVVSLMRYLKAVKVCDSRLPERACPKSN